MSGTSLGALRSFFKDPCGKPLRGGQIYTYDINSATLKNTYADRKLTIVNTNPVILDYKGEAEIFLNGLYRIIVKDRHGVVVYDENYIGEDPLSEMIETFSDYANAHVDDMVQPIVDNANLKLNEFTQDLNLKSADVANAVNQAQSTAQLAITSIQNSVSDSDAVKISAISDMTSIVAQVEAAVLINGSSIYNTVAEGLAATQDGEKFSVRSTDPEAFIDEYVNEAGVAQKTKSYPSALHINSLESRVVSVVESIADLVNINNPKDGQVVYVKDLQGGDFVYKSALASQNDGIIVFNGWTRVWISLKPNPAWAGAIGNGIADDSDAIQKLIEFAIKNKISIESNSLKYTISKTLIIPSNFDNTFVNDRKITLDFGESDFILTQDVTLFTSGYYDNGVLKTNYDTPKMFVNSFQVVLSGFTISSRVGYLKATMLKIQDWHQGCEIKNIASHVCRTMLESNNNFYTKFTKIDASYSEGGFIGTRFIFKNEHNLCAFERLSATNSDIGYQFNASLTACTFRQISLEGLNIGAQFNSAVYDLTIADCYEENIGDVAYQFNDYAFSVKFIGGYCNFIDHPDAHFLEYKPSPANDIHIDSGYHFANIYSKSQIIKNKENIYGLGININFMNAHGNDISELNVENSEFGNKINIHQKLRWTGFYGNVNNELIAGNYSGRYTLGFSGQQGFKWVNDSSSILKIQTAIKNSQTQKIYVNIAVSYNATTTIIAGEFIGGYDGSKFYKYTDSGLTADAGLNITVVNGLVQINGGFLGAITQVVGEVRLI